MGVDARAGVPIAKTDNCLSRDTLRHEGNFTAVHARTSFSKRLSHGWHTYAYIGIGAAPIGWCAYSAPAPAIKKDRSRRDCRGYYLC
jgi:23S rRNA C2498 (ribose-2'-O)-methylase RlmM